MSAKWMKAVNITSLSKREKTLLKPLSRRNNRSISLRRRYDSVYCHGLTLGWHDRRIPSSIAVSSPP